MGCFSSVFAPNPKPAYRPPPVQVAPAVEEIDEEEKKAKKGRRALLRTKGGLAGEEVQLGQTAGRGTLGNV